MAIASLPPLLPGVKRSAWRVHNDEEPLADVDPNESDAYVAVRRQALSRDRYTCRYCGFSSVPDRQAHASTYLASGYLELHHVDDDHTNNAPDNLVTVCPFCHQVFHAGNAGHRQAAWAIWAPWIDQARLNLLSNLVLVSMCRDDAYSATARRLYEQLLEERESMRAIYGEGMDDCAVFGSLLMRLSGERNARGSLYDQRELMFSGVRLLPRAEAYERHIAYWSDRVWLPGSRWEDLIGESNLLGAEHAS